MLEYNTKNSSNTGEIYSYFKELWFNEKEIDIYLALYKLWTQPASIIAKHISMERTYVYKILIKLRESWLLEETIKWWVKHFFISDIEQVKNYTKDQTNKFKKLEDQFETIKKEFYKYDNSKLWYIPKISIYDWNSWIENAYKSIVENTLKNGYIQIKLFASNTIDWDNFITTDIKNITNNFLLEIKKNKINIDTSLWNGMYLMENKSKVDTIEELTNIISHGTSVCIYVVWQSIYFFIFKETPIAIKIDSLELADVMHFLLKNFS
jgi:hypothetical protein